MNIEIVLKEPHPNAFAFNMGADNPLTKDVRVRQAMQMALDLETMNDTYSREYPSGCPGAWWAGPAVGGTPFEEWPEEVRKTFMYDPEGAEADNDLMKEMGQ